MDGLRGKTKPGDDHVVVESFLAFFHLGGVDQIEAGVDTDNLQVFDKGKNDALEGRAVVDKLNGQPLALAHFGGCRRRR